MYLAHNVCTTQKCLIDKLGVSIKSERRIEKVFITIRNVTLIWSSSLFIIYTLKISKTHSPFSVLDTSSLYNIRV